MPFYTDPITKMEHKFACNHCIRGHRSTNCSHNDRPLFYIRKKGRPVSQCTQCRALRKNRSLHTRCECPNRVQNKGLGGMTDFADLPHGMTIEAAKEFVERLTMDQGGCRNCNSSRCQCDVRSTQSIAPASSSSSPATPISGGELHFSPGFSTTSSSQMRDNIYPPASPQYATIPQLAGMPTFGTFQPSSTPSMSAPMNPVISAQVQQFQRRHEHLMASTQRRIQQEVEWVRKQNRGPENQLGPVQHPPAPLPDLCHHRASLPVNFESSAHNDPVSRITEQSLDLYYQGYRDARSSVPGHAGMYDYTQDVSQTLSHFPYVASLSTTIFRPTVIELEQKKRSGPSIISGWRLNEETRSRNPPVAITSHVESKTSSNISSALETANTRNLAAVDVVDQSINDIEAYKLNLDGERRDSHSVKPSAGEVPEEESTASAAFQGLDKIFDTLGEGDNEWLYSLQTECARPGAVCECGDSCCCPGCFTHTNNPGDRGVYNTMLSKLEAILEPEEEEQDSTRSKPCVPTSTKSTSNSTEAKL